MKKLVLLIWLVFSYSASSFASDVLMHTGDLSAQAESSGLACDRLKVRAFLGDQIVTSFENKPTKSLDTVTLVIGSIAGFKGVTALNISHKTSDEQIVMQASTEDKISHHSIEVTIDRSLEGLQSIVQYKYSRDFKSVYRLTSSSWEKTCLVNTIEE